MQRQTFAAGVSFDEDGHAQIIVECCGKAYLFDDPKAAGAAMNDMLASQEWNAMERECLTLVSELVASSSIRFARLAETQH